MEINKTPLTRCIKNRPLGLTPAVDPMKDLVFKKDYQCNSWWVGGNGTFCWQETLTHQISVPTMETVGTITVDGHTYTLKDNGYSWFDRQWQNNAKNPKRLMNLAWAWMCIRMENGDVISVWSNPVDEQEDSFATIRHLDGTQTVTYAKPLSSGITHYWHSENSGKDWPVGWDVELPEFDCKLHVATYPYNQEMYSEMKLPGSCYEGISRVTGTYAGLDVNARCFVEITGEWSGRCAKTGAEEVK